MDDEIKKMMEEIARADRQRQIAELKVIDTIYPDDIGAWLDGLEANLKRAEQKITTDAAGDIIDTMTSQLRVARKQQRMTDSDNLKITVMTLRDNWQRLLDNKSLQVEKSFSADQKTKSVKALAARWGNREQLNQIYETLANLRDDWDTQPKVKDLWSLFFSYLEEKELSPDDSSGEKIRNNDRMSWEGNSEGITFKRFGNIISELRNKKT